MEKLVQKALENHTPNLNNLMRVLKGTGNVQIAAEILLGIYEEPKISAYPSLTVRDMYCEPEFKEFDPFNEKVIFTYYSSNIKRGWLSVDETVYTTDRFVSTKSYADDAAAELDMPEEDFKKQYKRVTVFTDVDKSRLRESDISLRVWNEDGINSKPVPDRVFETQSTTL